MPLRQKRGAGGRSYQRDVLSPPRPYLPSALLIIALAVRVDTASAWPGIGKSSYSRYHLAAISVFILWPLISRAYKILSDTGGRK